MFFLQIQGDHRQNAESWHLKGEHLDPLLFKVMEWDGGRGECVTVLCIFKCVKQKDDWG